MNFFIRKNCALDGQTSQAKSTSQSVNLPGTYETPDLNRQLLNPDHDLSVFNPEQLSKKLSAFKDPLLDLTGDSPVPDEVNSMY